MTLAFIEHEYGHGLVPIFRFSFGIHSYLPLLALESTPGPEGAPDGQVLHCKWKKMDDMKVMFVFIRVMLADESYVPVNESYHYKMAFGLCAWKQT